MFPGTKRPIVLPENYSPPEIGCVDVNLANHLMEKFGCISHLPINQTRNINFHLLDLNIVEIWNGCNGCPVDLLSELSLDATPRNHYFLSKVASKPVKHRYVSVQRYSEEKYKMTLNYPNSPLLRDRSGSFYPLESIWLRLRLF